jgi:hypothetical protein
MVGGVGKWVQEEETHQSKKLILPYRDIFADDSFVITSSSLTVSHPTHLPILSDTFSGIGDF